MGDPQLEWWQYGEVLIPTGLALWLCYEFIETLIEHWQITAGAGVAGLVAWYAIAGRNWKPDIKIGE